MPVSSGEPPRRRSRRDQPREWTGLDTAAGFERCVRATLRELYGYVALLTGRDRREAERLVTDVYRSLFRAVQAGHIRSVTLGALRSAGRRTWLDAHRDQLVAIDEVSTAPASTIADLSMLERAVLVLRYVNGMSVHRAAAEVGRSDRDVAVLSAHAVRRLRGTDDTSGTWLRAYLGPTVTPSGGLVDRIVRQLGDATTGGPGPVETGPVDTAPVDTAPVDTGAVDVGDRPEPESDDVPAETAETVEPDEAAAPDADVRPEEPAARDADVRPDEAAAPDGDVRPEELPTSELAIVDRPTVELPTVERAAPTDGSSTAAAHTDAVEEVVAAEGAVGPTLLPDEPGSEVEHGRPRWVVAVGALLVALLVVALIWLVLRGDTADTAESADSIADDAGSPDPATPADSDPAGPDPSTAPASTDPPAPTGPVQLGLDPPCVERVGDRTVTTAAWSDTLVPLAPAPTLEISLPESVDVAAEPSRAPVRTSVILRPDGAIVTARPAASHRAGSTMVSRLGLDGTVAWVRCLDGDAVVAARPDAGVELAVRTGGAEGVWSSLALADGATGEPLDSVQSAILEAPTTATVDASGPTLGYSYDSGLGRTVPAVLDDGRVVWTASDVVLPEAGSFRAATVGTVVVVQSCVETDGKLDCAAGELRGYDLESGELLWARPGSHRVAATGDAVALVGDDSGWQLVDVATGDDVDGQRWVDPGTFDAGDDPDSFVEQVGGAVIVARPSTVAIWLPADVELGTSAVAIP